MSSHFSIRRHLGWMFLWLCLGPGVAEGQTKEYEIKAAFLLNFAHFVEWPESAFADRDAPFVIGVLGDDPFGPALAETVKGEKIHDHKLEVRRVRRLEELDGCQLVFISKSERSRWAEILSKIDSKPIVTVSELPGFAREGGTINFYTEQNKVRFEINSESARRGGLKFSSQLLGLAKMVQPPKSD